MVIERYRSFGISVTFISAVHFYRVQSNFSSVIWLAFPHKLAA